MTRTAQVKRDARVGEAEARRDAGIKVFPLFHVGVFAKFYMLDLIWRDVI